MKRWWFVLLAGCSAESPYMREGRPDAPVAGEARVVFYRPSSYAPGARPPVYAGERLLGFAEAQSRFEVRLPAGRHLLFCRAENDSAIDAELAAGKTYHVRITLGIGIMEARARFEPVTRASEHRAKLAEELQGCRLRELDAAKGAEFLKGKEESVRALRLRFEGPDRKDAAVLKPEDGD